MSKLQATIALSTTESEYTALSHAMRIIIPMRELILELFDQVSSPRNPSKISFHVHEDNSSAGLLATRHHVSSRNRHFNVKFHHFWQSVKERKIFVESCPTEKQQADYLTKGLSQSQVLVLPAYFYV